MEVEIFNADVWAADPDGVLALMKDRYTALVAPALAPPRPSIGEARDGTEPIRIAIAGTGNIAGVHARALGSVTAGSAAGRAMVMSLRHDATALVVEWDDADLFRYVYLPDDPQLESPRPYLHPVRTLGGDLVSLYRPHDHVWHKGIALSLPNMGQENSWGGPTFRAGGYVQLPNDGAMMKSFGLAVAKDGIVRIDEGLSWVTESGLTPVTEHRRIAAAAWPDAAAWDLAFETTLRNVSGADIVIGSPTTEGRPNAGYGGLFWRGPRSFTGGTVVTPDGTGGDELMGVRGPWLAFAGRHDEHGRWSTLVFRDAPENFSYPSQWFVRSTPYACLCPAPFFDTTCTFPAGASLVLRYDIAVADGQLDPAACARLAARAAADDLLT